MKVKGLELDDKWEVPETLLGPQFYAFLPSPATDEEDHEPGVWTGHTKCSIATGNPMQSMCRALVQIPVL